MLRPGGTDAKETIVITGSDGLIGSALVRALHEKYHVVGLDNDRASDLGGLQELFYCDLTDEASVREAFRQLAQRRGKRIASFIHLAAYYDFSGEDSPLYDELTVGGTRRVLRHLQSFDVEQFVFSSTILVMKPSEDGRPIDESSPLKAEWRYPESKIETEELIAKERGRIPAVILRIGGVYDEWGRSMPIAQQMKRIYEKDLESYVFPGDADHGQTMLHIEDLVRCFERVIERRRSLAGFEPFLIGEPSVMSYEELQEQIGELLHGEEWPSIRIPKALAKLGARAKRELTGDDDFIQPWMIDLADQHYPIDIAKARRLLDWQPEHELRDTLPKIAANLIQDPAEWSRMNGLKEPVEARTG
jgi:nucleoside-diphosphate-sugar epimerase